MIARGISIKCVGVYKKNLANIDNNGNWKFIENN